MQLLDLDQEDDPRLEPYRALRERDLAGRLARFVAEGRVVVETLLARGRFPCESVLVSERAFPAACAMLEALAPPTLPVLRVPETLLRQLVGYDLHRGLLAVGRRTAPPEPGALLDALGPGPRTVLVLEGLTNHDNVGACLRNAAALGADAVLLDATCADPLYRKAIRVSVGHALTLPWTRTGSATALVDALHARDFLVAALALDADARPLERCTRPAPRLALLLGSEGPGLSAAARAAADHRLAIPMAPGVDSLNVATAGAIALFALRAARE